MCELQGSNIYGENDITWEYPRAIPRDHLGNNKTVREARDSKEQKPPCPSLLFPRDSRGLTRCLLLWLCLSSEDWSQGLVHGKHNLSDKLRTLLFEKEGGRFCYPPTEIVCLCSGTLFFTRPFALTNRDTEKHSLPQS